MVKIAGARSFRSLEFGCGVTIHSELHQNFAKLGAPRNVVRTSRDTCPLERQIEV